MFRRRRNRFAQDQGQAAVEFALVLPVLCFILLAILQFGIVFKNYVALTDGVRAGARKAAVSRELANRDALTVDAVRRSSRLGTGLNVTVSSTWASGSEVSVEATFPYRVNLLGIVTVRNGVLRSTTTERVE